MRGPGMPAAYRKGASGCFPGAAIRHEGRIASFLDEVLGPPDSLIMAVSFRAVAANFHRTPSARAIAGVIKKKPAATLTFANPTRSIRKENIGRGPDRFAYDLIHRIVRRADQGVSFSFGNEIHLGGGVPKPGVEGGQIHLRGSLGTGEWRQQTENQGANLAKPLHGLFFGRILSSLAIQKIAPGAAPFQKRIPVRDKVICRGSVAMVIGVAEIKAE